MSHTTALQTLIYTHLINIKNRLQPQMIRSIQDQSNGLPSFVRTNPPIPTDQASLRTWIDEEFFILSVDDWDLQTTEEDFIDADWFEEEFPRFLRNGGDWQLLELNNAYKLYTKDEQQELSQAFDRKEIIHSCTSMISFVSKNVQEGWDFSELPDANEYYIITAWLREKLDWIGENTCQIFEFDVWCRESGGQSTYMDFPIMALACYYRGTKHERTY